MLKLDFLTGLRGLAAIWVVFYHIKSYTEPYVYDFIYATIARGYLAVDFFFMLSGFIISYTYFDKLSKKTLYAFYVKRIARIYPLHIFLLLIYLSIPIAFFIANKPFPADGKYTLDSFLLSVLLIHNWGFLDQLTWNIPSWSISTEFASYLLFPLFIYIPKKINSTKFPFIISAVLLALMGLYCSYFGIISLGNDIARHGLLRCLIEFNMGIYLYLAVRHSKLSKEILAIIFIFGVSIFIYLFITKNYDFIYAPIATYLILFGLIGNESLITKALSCKILVFLGDISYSIYLVHFYIRDVFKLFLDSNSASLTWIFIYVSTVISVSIILYNFVEKPARTKFTALLLDRKKCG